MKRIILSIAVLMLLHSIPTHANSAVRFITVDVYIDSAEPLAAWQFEFSSVNGGMKIVGVENGESDAFADAPYYDREAVELGRADRIVVADYSLLEESALPRGRARVTTLHLMLSGDTPAEFDTQLVIATAFNGNRIDAGISFEISAGSKK